jgi:hypothetical protein
MNVHKITMDKIFLQTKLKKIPLILSIKLISIFRTYNFYMHTVLREVT